MKKYLTALFIFFLALDQGTKLLVKSKMELYESIPVIKGLFNFTYVLNPGAAFGFLAKMDEAYRKYFFILVTLLAIIAVAFLMYKELKYKLRAVSYTLIIAGAFGNFIDRLYMGKVVDFLDFYIGAHHWPAFNIADSAITIGIGLLIIDILFMKRTDSLDNTQAEENGL